MKKYFNELFISFCRFIVCKYPDLKWIIIYNVLTEKERSIFLINLNNRFDDLEQYANCLGETYEEYVEEVIKFKQNICYGSSTI